ncbi:translocation/assembly module TamB domain-containing protein [Stakelama saccharophila]|uniref:Translocation/assembly module TamB domain-containing protein n=1 Tax=Stakelama saccharophila TaxID=3075605 RepID=A0ABZ0B8D6_9SPHN|nr:translocation/assembly module TamB domain-containing protein [Stakelama sp. W311]WNO53290.1 translocation/assembly module TamB domain-containing protein [Stakelama sp. W311]
MTEERDIEAPDDAPLERAPRWRWPRRIAGGLFLVLGLLAAVMAVLDTDIGHRFVTDRIAGIETPSGLRFRIGRIDGSLYSEARLRDVRIYDPEGLVFAAPRVALNWRPLSWVSNRLDIRSLIVPHATLAKLPELRETKKKGPILPGFDIRIDALRIDDLTIAKRITGVERHGQLRAKADVRSGRALVLLRAEVAGSDRVALFLDADPDRDRFDLDVMARGSADGLLAKLTSVARPLRLAVTGDGRWSDWSGRAFASAGDTTIVDMRLGNREGQYTLAGIVAPASLTHGKLQRLSAPQIRVTGAATLRNRVLDGNIALRSRALDVQATGAVDLGGRAYRDVRLRASLLRPPALFPNMTGRNIELRAILDGGFATAAFDYRLVADRFAIDDTGFEEVRASGKGHLSEAPVTVPITVHAGRVTGVGDVAGGILHDLTVSGALRVTADAITGDDLKVRSDKLNAQITLRLDLHTGHYVVGFSGGLRRYEIPGLGIVDVESKLNVVPGAGGHGSRVAGHGSAQMVRLDNAFFRSLTNGLPHIESDLERGPDMVLHFKNLKLTSPGLTLTGTGYRRRDGTFHFEGRGTQTDYGPLTIVLDGKIDHPTLDLEFAAPNDALGLRDVVAHLDPTDAGFAYRAQGRSRLGPFTANGAILLPRGDTARIVVAGLDVTQTHATGALDIVEGGFSGQLDLSGGGLSGQLALQPVGDIQRISGTINARRAALGPGMRVARGHLEFAALLAPAGTSLEATASLQGLQRGALSIARLNGSARLRGGEGEVRASFAGSRGRMFDLDTVTTIADGRYRVRAEGTLDKKPIRLDSPAVLSRSGDGWRLEPTTLTFSGGSASISGMFGSAGTRLEAQVDGMPMTVLDIAFPELGLGGTASGALHYAAGADGGAPTGRIDMKIRGLTRSGLVLSSKPVDVGLAAILQPDKAVMRAVAASEGKTIGRAQARLAPLSAGDFVDRLAGAPLFAQIRYDGPADTLWRLTGVELFDLSGPVAIGADVGGTLNDPRIRGSLQTSDARIQSAAIGTNLEQVKGRGRFNGSRLVIDSFTASDGRDGSVSGSGAFDFSFGSGIGIDLKLQATKARLIARDDIAAVVSGPIAIRSDGSGGTISGDVTLDSSRYRLGQATAATEVPQIDTREINLPFGGEAEEEPAAPWTLDLRAKADNKMVVTGLGLSSEWSADLRIGGQPTDPRIRGRLDLIRGDYEFAGRTFDLERGAIRFEGAQPPNPALDIEANADTQGLSATIRVTGTAAQPEIGFSSTPALPEDELLSRLLFGTSITDLSAPEALQLASAVAALQEGGGGLDPINAVRRAAGLDRLRILPADPQTGQSTSIAAGKYITRNTYVEIISDGQGYSATRAEFQITRWLSLLSSVSTIGRQSVNVRVSKDY